MAVSQTPSSETPRVAPRRWYRFSLRTLLVAITIIAIGLGYAFYRPIDRVRRTLNEACEVTLVDVPLREARDVLQRQHGLLIILDRQGLQENGIGEDEIVSLDVRHANLESALNLLTEQLDQSWVAEPTLVMITSQNRAEEQQVVRGHAFTDLVHHDALGRLDYGSLHDVLTSCVMPDSWERASIGFASTRDKVLVTFPGTARHHEQVDAFLNALRIALKQPSQPVRVVLPQFAAYEGRIREVLERPWDISLQNKPLKDAIRQLRDHCQVEIQLDVVALIEADILPTVAVSLDAADTPLRELLEQLLEPLSLRAVVDRGMLRITTPEKAAELVEVVMYPVGDLDAGKPSHYVPLLKAVNAAVKNRTGPLVMMYDNVLICCAEEPHQRLVAQAIEQCRSRLAR